VSIVSAEPRPKSRERMRLMSSDSPLLRTVTTQGSYGVIGSAMLVCEPDGIDSICFAADVVRVLG
jgi:hypothetical protein